MNTRDPQGMVDAEIKRYKVEYPVFYGRGQNINSDFKVQILPRLIVIKADSTIHKDVLFMKDDELRAEIDSLLAESPAATDTLHAGSENKVNPKSEK